MKAFRKILAVTIMASAFAFSPPASADGSAAVVAAVKAAGSLIAGWISSMNNAMLAFMAADSAQVHADMEKQNIVNQAIAQATLDAENQQKLKEHANDIEERTADTGTFCQAMNMGTKLNSASMSRAAVSAAISKDDVERNMNTPSTSVVVAKRFEEHAEKYCSDIDRDRGRCAQVAPADKQNLDLRADAFFEPSESMTYTREQKEAAEAFANGVVNPFPASTLPKNWEKTPQGKAYVVAQMVEQQRLALAKHSLNQAIAARSPTSEIGNFLLSSLGVQSPSMMGIFKNTSEQFTNPGWHKAVATAPNATWLLKENVRQAAFGNWMDYNAYLQMERMETLLAASLAIDSKASSQALLNAQRDSAAKAQGRNSQ